MPNPSGPDRDDTPDPPAFDHDAGGSQPVGDGSAPAAPHAPDADEQATDSYPVVAADSEAATEVFATEALTTGAEPESRDARQLPAERRFTAPGFDAGKTEIIQSVPEPATEVFTTAQADPGKAPPQLIPPRLARKLPAGASRSWGWVLALILVILALAAIAVLGTLWLTREGGPKASQQDRVRETIYNFDVAVQNGDLPALRGLTCGSARDNYLNVNDQAWADTYRRVAAAKRYPVIADIDEIVVNGEHAEANVTAFMAYAPQVRSTRSIDLQYRDDQWKICQSPAG